MAPAGRYRWCIPLTGKVEDLQPGKSFELTIDFTPQSYMDYEIQLVVESNDDTPKAYDAIGHGSDSELHEEFFKQPDVQDVDVLWVIDNSDSMSVSSQP